MYVDYENYRQHIDDITIYVLNNKTSMLTIFPAISGQQFSFNNLRTSIVFPGSGIRDTLASFRNQESLPQIHLPQAFLRAAKGIEASLGKLPLARWNVSRTLILDIIFYSEFHPQIYLVHVLDDDTVEVVNVVMNNMENYLPSDVIKQDKDV